MENKQDIIESILAEYPICEYCFGDTTQIPFSDKVLVICETDCKRYGHCWACPPHAGNIYENMDKCRKFQRFVLFSTVWEVSDAYNLDACAEAQRSHAAMTRELREQVEKEEQIYSARTRRLRNERLDREYEKICRIYL